MTESVFSKDSRPSYKWQWKSPRESFVTEYVFSFRVWESVFSNVSEIYHKWQWRSLWWSLLLALDCDRLFLINLHAFTINSSEGVRDGVCVLLHALTESDYSKASGLYYEWQWDILWQSLWWSLLLASVCEKVCF